MAVDLYTKSRALAQLVSGSAWVCRDPRYGDVHVCGMCSLTNASCVAFPPERCYEGWNGLACSGYCLVGQERGVPSAKLPLHV